MMASKEIVAAPAPEAPSTAEVPTERQATRHAAAFADTFMNAIEKETDRGVIIVAATMMDSALLDVLRNFFVPAPSRDDDLLEGGNAPLSTFASRIDIAFRCGLIPVRMTRELHLFRRMRNDCAHELVGVTFSDPQVRSRTLELTRSQPHLARERSSRFPPGVRGDFVRAATWTLWTLHCIAERSTPTPVCSESVGFFGRPAKKKAEKK